MLFLLQYLVKFLHVHHHTPPPYTTTHQRRCCRCRRCTRTTVPYHTPPYTTAQHTTVHQGTPPYTSTVHHHTQPYTTAHHRTLPCARLHPMFFWDEGLVNCSLKPEGACTASCTMSSNQRDGWYVLTCTEAVHKRCSGHKGIGCKRDGWWVTSCRKAVNMLCDRGALCLVFGGVW